MLFKGSFKVPIYGCTVHIYVTDDLLGQINKLLKRLELDKLEVAPRAYFIRPGNSYAAYHLFFCKTELSVDSIHHEKSHLLDHILEDRQIVARCEARAYLDGYVSDKLDTFFKSRPELVVNNSQPVKRRKPASDPLT